MKRALFYITILFSLFSCSTANRDSDSNQRKAKLYYNQGTSNLVQKEYTKALKNLIESYKLYPKDTQTLNNLGMAYYFKNNVENALKFINEAIALDPKNSDARMNLGTIYLNQGKYFLAEEQYKIILEDLVYEGQYKTYYNLAQIELKRNQPLQAKTYLKQSIGVFENYCPAHYQLGDIAFKDGKYSESLSHYHNAGLGVCYNNPDSFLKEADALIKLKRFTQARLKLKDVLKRFMTTRFELLAQKKLNYLNKLEQSDQEIETRLLKEEDLSSPNF